MVKQVTATPVFQIVPPDIPGAFYFILNPDSCFFENILYF